MLKTTICLMLGTALAGAAAPPAAAPLRVMSFNIRYGTADDKENRWDRRKELVAAVIGSYDPDLLGTQESLEFQGEFLAGRLPGHTAFGVGRDDGAKRGEATMVYFRTERFEKLDGGHFWLGETPDRPGVKGWDADCPRMVTWLKLRDLRADGRELVWLNTHWDHQGVQARLESARQIRRWLADRAEHLPVVVTGDFNCTEGAEPYATLAGGDDARPQLVDSFRAVQPQRQPDEASFHPFNGNPRGSRIDWILCSPDLKPVAAAIDRSQQDGRYPSDHYPVTATLEWLTAVKTQPRAEAPVPRPGPPPEIAPEALRDARARGIAWLVANQNPDGSWGGIRRTKAVNVAAHVPGAHYAFTAATTALVIEALCHYPGHSAAADAALDRAAEWLVGFLPQVKRVSHSQVYNNWAHAYSIHALLALRARAQGDPARQEQLLAAVIEQVRRLETYEFLDGGWGYYSNELVTATPTGATTCFTTATGLIALDAARKAGVEVPARLTDRAVRSILRQRTPDGAYVYSMPHYKVPRRDINRPAGSLGRAPACNAALRLWTGRDHVADDDITDWLDRLITRGEWLNMARKTPIPHESYFKNSGYFCYYAYYYAGRCAELLDEERLAPRRNHLIKALLDQQEPDGCWWDYPLYDYHFAYGTAYALSALARLAPP